MMSATRRKILQRIVENWRRNLCEYVQNGLPCYWATTRLSSVAVTSAGFSCWWIKH